MAWTVIRYRADNPGTNSRGFNLTAGDADTTINLSATFDHNAPWTPDEWDLQSTDGSGCRFIGLWRAQVNTTTVIVTKGVGAGSGGAVRLTLKRNNQRP